MTALGRGSVALHWKTGGNYLPPPFVTFAWCSLGLQSTAEMSIFCTAAAGLNPPLKFKPGGKSFCSATADLCFMCIYLHCIRS